MFVKILIRAIQNYKENDKMLIIEITNCSFY